ncbi:SpoIIE family protein phosphatase [Mycobacterium camsae]|uniref:SpoIIE family protein phosphatase n=1 Tax=Mycobacterium gordonae TaxID=1778 RepID=UPI001F11CC5B|nr:SpoIIE family protein phosphatase [Mycobacterium gordonae]
MNFSPLPADLTTAVKLGGEMGRRFADFDWAVHPLGPPRQWAAEIRTTVAGTLTSRSPTIVFLRAPELFVWHNDAYLSLLGHDDAGALGRSARELWWDSWDQIEPILTGVLSTGVATWSHGLMLPPVSGSKQRDVTFAVNPVLGSDGAVSAVLAAATDVAHPVARQLAEQAAGLLALDAAVRGADSIAGLLDTVLRSAFASGDAAAAAVGVVVDGEDHVQFEFAGALPSELRDRYHVARLDSPLVGVDVIATGQPMVVPDTLALPARYAHAVHDTASSVRACVAYPLRGGNGRVMGVLTLLWPQTRRFADAELELFARTADITAAAVDRIRLAAREHRVAVDFQEHLLDLDRGATAAVVAAVYQPAGEVMRVGGDWFSATGLDRPDRIGVSVGDVVGHGLPAAIVMSRLRAAVTVSALTASDPASVLGALDRYALTVAGARCATVAYAAIDTGVTPARISYLCAGHPYPLLVLPEQGPVYLRGGRRPPVATGAADEGVLAATAELPPGSLALLYTDGLIERAGESLDEGFDRLKAAAVECAGLPVESVCAELLRRMTPPGGYRDDVVVLAVRPCHAGERSFARVVPATSDHVPAARKELREWLAATAAGRAEDILLAVSEAVTNAIEHGSSCEAHKTVSIEAFLRPDAVWISVSDSGRWVGDSSASRRSRRRGRGLTLISGLADKVDTVRTPSGTRVTLRFDRADDS